MIFNSFCLNSAWTWPWCEQFQSLHRCVFSLSELTCVQRSQTNVKLDVDDANMPRYTLPSPLLSCLLFLFVCLFRCHSVKLANAISQKSTCFSKYIPLNHQILIMLLGSWGLVCDNENPSPSVDPLQWPDCVTVTAWRPDWDRGVWQPACMANKLTRDPCDNEWTRHRISAGARLCVCACMRTSGQRTDSAPVEALMATRMPPPTS